MVTDFAVGDAPGAGAEGATGEGSPTSEHERIRAEIARYVAEYLRSGEPPPTESRRDGYAPHRGRDLGMYLTRESLGVSDSQFAAAGIISSRSAAYEARKRGARRAREWAGMLVMD